MNLPGSFPKAVRVEKIRGERQIIARLDLLRAVAEEWGQAAELAEVPFLLSVPATPRRQPLLLVLRSGQETDSEQRIVGAVIVFGHGAALFGDRLLGPSDRSGRRCVFGPSSHRAAIAALIARRMIQEGAALVVVPFSLEGSADAEVANENSATVYGQQNAIAALGMLGAGADLQWTLRRGWRRGDLPLERDFEDTLRQFGRRTRRNVRAAIRRIQGEKGAHLELDPVLPETELVEIDRQCTHPVRRGVTRWRYEVWKKFPDAFVAGLRSADGEWMGLAGGRRVDNGVTLDWQINVKDFTRYSVSLVMRALLMEHFGNEGITRMRFEGGTSHAIIRRLPKTPVFTLIVQADHRWLRGLEWVAARFFPDRASTRNLFQRRDGDVNEGDTGASRGRRLPGRLPRTPRGSSSAPSHD